MCSQTRKLLSIFSLHLTTQIYGMNTSEFDLLPFIEPFDGTPSVSLSDFVLCVASMVVFQFVYTTARKVIPDKKRAARIAPLLHGVYASVTALYVMLFYSPFFDPPNTICESVGPSKYFMIITLGYFIWDLIVCLQEGWGVDWVIHAVFCVTLFGMAVVLHTLQRWGMMVLFYELSTVFLHCYNFLFYYGYNRLGWWCKLSDIVSRSTFTN